ncbi:SDR family oxidoreductase [Hyalangium versicolor]|uniref:SDR family oxidoreductase n=1 Tax=Hyalangium versicolor TaxID=2861190 RepID=UPI001CC9DC10|nr:SDR family oxidoreductase [Hyalangium versicolor]
MDLGLKGKRALVLGASWGLGFAVASELVKEGARVAICSSNEERIRAAAANMGAALGVAADLSKPGGTQGVINKVKEVFGGLDILVHNTGGPPPGNFSDLSDAQWQEGFQGLWMGAVEGLRTAIPIMKEQRWGRIILITSVSSREAINGMLVSSSIRSGLLGLTKAVSNEVGEYGITVNAVLPGFHATEKLREFKLDEEKLAQSIPVRRLGRPEELGALVTFLASEQAAYITGQSVAIDGGWMRGF